MNIPTTEELLEKICDILEEINSTLDHINGCLKRSLEMLEDIRSAQR
jgi:hypothetical protein